jgi:hypothetical protein
MKTKLSLIYTLILSAFVTAGYALAGGDEKMIIELKTNDFELAETDISDLEIGESETIVTESGKTIDLLRTADGVEVYVDGELLDTPKMGAHEMHHGEMHHGDHDGKMIMKHKEIIIECEVDGEAGDDHHCGNEMIFVGDGDIDIEALHERGDAHKVIVKRMHKSCSSDEEGECEDVNVWVSDGEDVSFGELHEASEGHKVIRIHKSVDGEVDGDVEKIIVIEKD